MNSWIGGYFNSALFFIFSFLGIDNVYNCNLEPYIPIYLIVGSVSFILFSLAAYCAILWGRWERSMLAKTALFFVYLIYLFLLGWNIAGSYWAFRQWSDWKDSDSTDLSDLLSVSTCHNETYKLTFGFIIIYWILFPLHLVALVWKSKKIFENLD